MAKVRNNEWAPKSLRINKDFYTPKVFDSLLQDKRVFVNPLDEFALYVGIIGGELKVKYAAGSSKYVNVVTFKDGTQYYVEL